MTDAEIKQKCLDASNAAIALFDLIDEHGKDAVLETHDGLKAMMDLMVPVEGLRTYYQRRNIARMLALGVSPEQLMRAATGG